MRFIMRPQKHSPAKPGLKRVFILGFASVHRLNLNGGSLGRYCASAYPSFLNGHREFPRMNLRVLILAAALGQCACRQDLPVPAAAEALPAPARVLTVDGSTGPVESRLAEGEVVLTFDDGPHGSRTRDVLDLLDAAGARATFFLAGHEAKNNPDGVREIVARGHTVASHSFDHADLTSLSIPEALANIAEGAAAIEAATGERPRLFRFPFVRTTPELSAAVRAAGYIEIGVTANGADWTDISPEESVAMIMATLEAGGRRGVILLHDPYAGSATRTDLLLKALKAGGYEVVALQ
jgi:peptidoglycan-N-acetylglucosamine deacetylase